MLVGVWVVVVGRLLVVSLWAGTPKYGVPPLIAMVGKCVCC